MKYKLPLQETRERREKYTQRKQKRIIKVTAETSEIKNKNGDKIILKKVGSLKSSVEWTNLYSRMNSEERTKSPILEMKGITTGPAKNKRNNMNKSTHKHLVT